MSPVIQVEHLSKHYRLGLIGGGTLREDLHRWWAKARGRPDPLLKIGQEDHGNREGGELWALRDVSFQVQEGEILGIIGRNGAGKSTLLKILSRITAPTTGQVKIRGRVGSLLEVGTGFHPELTGRENIYLNGAILGMKKAEIDRKLDEIIDFAEIEPFIDTPVKRYSSGMYVRLAFAVAAHLEPEILVVDEVLAVGDAAFQKKCLGKMKDVSEIGRTVIFVSHNMSMIKLLCTNGIILKNGLIASSADSISNTVGKYLGELESSYYSESWKRQDSKKNEYFYVNDFRITTETGNAKVSGNDENHYFEVDFYVQTRLRDLRFGIVVYSDEGLPLFTSEYTDELDVKIFKFNIGRNRMRVKLPPHLLNEGTYTAEVTASSPTVGWILHPGKDRCPFVRFEIRGGLSNSPCWTTKRAGFFAPILEWEGLTALPILELRK